MRTSIALSLLLFTACDATEGGEGGGADVIVGEEGKADATEGVEVTGWLTTGTPAASNLTPALTRRGFVFYATGGTSVSVEVTQAGSAQGLDTVLKIHGPRTWKGTYDATLDEDDDEGFGKLSRLRGVTIPAEGFYLAEVATPAAPSSDKKFRVTLACTEGTCDRPGPINYGLELRWTQRAAELRALAHQAYQAATARVEELVDGGLTGDWAVVLDLDETVLSNLTYQAERAALGVAFSATSWTAWVERRAATLVPGAKRFIDRVHALGGRVVFVSNRKAAGECAPTEDNLDALGVTYDAILCRTDASDKNARFDSVEAGTAGLPAMPVVAFVGDNIQDFPDLTQEIRTQPESAYADFSERFFVIPNPMYGSWEKNP
jgi:5'-nucleotidase (lipoprotein e(P4) family)